MTEAYISQAPVEAGQPSFDEFMANQRALESELGYPPMDDKYYQDAYQRFLTRTR